MVENSCTAFYKNELLRFVYLVVIALLSWVSNVNFVKVVNEWIQKQQDKWLWFVSNEHTQINLELSIIKIETCTLKIINFRKIVIDSAKQTKEVKRRRMWKLRGKRKRKINESFSASSLTRITPGGRDEQNKRIYLDQEDRPLHIAWRERTSLWLSSTLSSFIATRSQPLLTNLSAIWQPNPTIFFGQKKH